MKLNVCEIFYSIQGESVRAGFPSLFIRLAGCNLNCKYCDTPKARKKGKSITIDSIVDEINQYQSVDHVTITGGEPLLQENIIELINKITFMRLKIQIETNGSLNLEKIPDAVRKIIDIKTPSSGESDSFLDENLNFITQHDELKFLISDISDYNFSKKFINKNLKKTKAVINFSPVHNSISYLELANLILSDRLPVRLNLQLHKIIGLD